MTEQIALGGVSGCRYTAHLCELIADKRFIKTRGCHSSPVVWAVTRVLEQFRMVMSAKLAKAACIIRQKLRNGKWYGVAHRDLDSSAKSANAHE